GGAAPNWERIRTHLRDVLGETTFRSWLAGLQYEGTEARQALFTVPTRFMREWIMSHYADDILRLLKMEDPTLLSLEIRVRTGTLHKTAASVTEPVKPAAVTTLPDLPAPTVASVATAVDVVDSSLYVGAPLDPRFTFENFVVGKPNELAHAAARRVADNDAVMQGCNPLFLYGGVGLGKTHLMHSIAWHIRRTN